MRIFDGVTEDFRKTIILSRKISSGKALRQRKLSSPSQNFAALLQQKLVDFQKNFKAGPCDSPNYEALDIHSFSTDTHMPKQTMLSSLYQ